MNGDPVCVLAKSWAASGQFVFVQVRAGRVGAGRLIAGVVVSVSHPERARVLVNKLVEWARAYYRVYIDDSALEWVGEVSGA